MRRAGPIVLAILAAGIMAAPAAPKPAGLKIIAVDVDGGAAVLIRTPEGKSLLIDAGWQPGAGNPFPVGAGAPPIALPISADRIAAAAASLGIKKIDVLIMTHYHRDHLGGLEALLAKLPVDTFVDHGPNREIPPSNLTPQRLAESPQARYPAWVAATIGHRHITAAPGQTLDLGSLHILFVSSDGKVLDAPLPGAGEANAYCASVKPATADGGDENNRSLGMLMSFGKTRMLYLGDLTWNKEVELLCPTNKVGKVDVYFVTGHGMNLSSSPPTAALDPLVAIMQNGALKGGDPEVIATVDSYGHLQGFWRNHHDARYPDLDGDPSYIANLDWVPDQGFSIGLDIVPGGAITVSNSRNRFSKTYQSRAAQNP